MSSLTLQSGKLPDQMILDSNDDSWIDYGDESPDGDLSGADFPLQLGKNLTGAFFNLLLLYFVYLLRAF